MNTNNHNEHLRIPGLLMSDGRAFSNYSPDEYLYTHHKTNGKMMSHTEYRKYITEHGDQLMSHNRNNHFQYYDINNSNAPYWASRYDPQTSDLKQLYLTRAELHNIKYGKTIQLPTNMMSEMRK